MLILICKIIATMFLVGGVGFVTCNVVGEEEIIKVFLGMLLLSFIGMFIVTIIYVWSFF